MFDALLLIVLTFIPDWRDHAARFREPFGKFQHIRLVNCSLYNSWYNLSRSGEISTFDSQNDAIVKKIPEGNYSLKTLGVALQEILKSEGVKVQLNTPNGGPEIHTPRNEKILLYSDLANLLGIKRQLQTINFF